VLEAVTVVEDFLAWELDLDRIEDPDIFKYLFFAGIRTVPKQLTVHCSLGTEIKIVELMDLHLILEPGKILLKPIPRYLLCSKFWVKHLIYCPSGDNRFNSPIQQNPEDAIPSKLQQNDQSLSFRSKRYHTALGFLRSYAALIRYESDFYIAQEHHLIPSGITWSSWRLFVKQLLCSGIECKSKRFQYSELRLGALNTIYRSRYIRYGYRPVYQDYTTFFRNKLTSILSFIAYITIVLTAMQTGLATDRLGKNDTFQNVSFRFAIFSIIAPLFLVAGLACAFLFLMVLDALHAIAVFNSTKTEQEEINGGL
jgi:hypothetical protein